MNKKQTLALGVIASAFVALSLTACKKDSKPSSDSDVTAAQDNSLAESNYNDVNTMVDASASAGTNFTFRMATDGNAREQSLFSGCAQVTVDTSNTTRKIVIDFGTSNCMCVDQRSRRGKIIATWTGRYRDSGTVVNISFDNYFVNDNQIKGTHKTTNKGKNAAAHLVYKVEVNGEIVKANNGGTITWVSTREREWVDGAATPLNLLDDIYSITGSASGTNASGSYTINITQAVVRKMNCRWFESGKIDITPAGKLTRTLDYGSTGCDANATVTIAGISFPVVLP
jgi:hypothetical protein